MVKAAARLITVLPLALMLVVAGCESMWKPDPREQLTQQLQKDLMDEIAAGKVQVKKEQDDVRLIVTSETLFPEGGWQINPRAKAALDKIAPTLRNLKNTKIVVSGYTDNTPIGPDLQRQGIADNRDLSSKRANTIVTYLEQQGVSPSLLSSQGFGDTQPIASNDTPEGRARNRRVEMTLIGPGT
jgi:chemotaxis protein MotB